MTAEANDFYEPNKKVIEQLLECYQELFAHEGHGKMSIEMRILKRGQKEVLINCGREYRFTVDCCRGCASGKFCSQTIQNKLPQGVK